MLVRMQTGYLEDVYPYVAEAMIASGAATKYVPTQQDTASKPKQETAALAPQQETATLGGAEFKRGPSTHAR